jgi:hypothetical protein
MIPYYKSNFIIKSFLDIINNSIRRIITAFLGDYLQHLLKKEQSGLFNRYKNLKSTKYFVSFD